MIGWHLEVNRKMNLKIIISRTISTIAIVIALLIAPGKSVAFDSLINFVKVLAVGGLGFLAYYAWNYYKKDPGE